MNKCWNNSTVQNACSARPTPNWKDVGGLCTGTGPIKLIVFLSSATGVKNSSHELRRMKYGEGCMPEPDF